MGRAPNVSEVGLSSLQERQGIRLVSVEVRECRACCVNGKGRLVAHVKNDSGRECLLSLYCGGVLCSSAKVEAGAERDVVLDFPGTCGNEESDPCYYKQPKTCSCYLEAYCGERERIPVECRVESSTVKILGVSHRAPCEEGELCVYLDVRNEGPCRLGASIDVVVDVLEGETTAPVPHVYNAPVEPGETGRVTIAFAHVYKWPVKLQIGVGQCNVITDTRVVVVEGPGGQKPPAISIEGVDTDKAVYEPGEDVGVTVRVRNTGEQACSDAWVRATLGESSDEWRGSLEPGSEESVTLRLKAPDSPGSYDVTVKAGCGGTATDTETVTVYVRRPSQPPPPPPPGKPRFEILDVKAPSEAKDGESYSVSVTVGNVGDADGRARVRAVVDGSTLEKEVEVAKGRSKTVTFTATASYPSDQWRVEVVNEATGGVDDSRAFVVRVEKPQPPVGEPRFRIAGVEAPREVVDGEEYSVRVSVVNEGGAGGTARVEAVVDGVRLGSREASVAAGGSAAVAFSVKASYPVDEWIVRIVNGATGLVDDSRSFTVAVRQPQPPTGGGGSGGSQGSQSAAALPWPVLAAGALVVVVALRARG